MGSSRQEYWSGLPCPPPGNLPKPGIETTSLKSPALASRLFNTSTTWEAPQKGWTLPFTLRSAAVIIKAPCELLLFAFTTRILAGLFLTWSFLDGKEIFLKWIWTPTSLFLVRKCYQTSYRYIDILRLFLCLPPSNKWKPNVKSRGSVRILHPYLRTSLGVKLLFLWLFPGAGLSLLQPGPRLPPASLLWPGQQEPGDHRQVAAHSCLWWCPKPHGAEVVQETCEASHPSRMENFRRVETHQDGGSGWLRSGLRIISWFTCLPKAFHPFLQKTKKKNGALTQKTVDLFDGLDITSSIGLGRPVWTVRHSLVFSSRSLFFVSVFRNH